MKKGASARNSYNRAAIPLQRLHSRPKATEQQHRNIFVLKQGAGVLDSSEEGEKAVQAPRYEVSVILPNALQLGTYSQNRQFQNY